MAEQINLDKALVDLQEFLPDEILDRWRRTRFQNRTRTLVRSIQPFLRGGAVGFSIVFYAQFLDEGTQFISADPFLQPVVDSDEVEEILTIAFEKDIDETIENTVQQGGGTIS